MIRNQTTQFDAITINQQAATVVDAPLLSWDVPRAEKPGSTFRVDLSQFVEGTRVGSPQLVKIGAARLRSYDAARKGYLSVAGHPELIRALAPTIRKWSYGTAPRTVNENLSQLKHLFNFLLSAEQILGTDCASQAQRKWLLADMSPELFLQFAEYLRRLGLSSSRMGSIYQTSRSFIERASGYQHLPSSPFSDDGDGEDALQYSHVQMKALLDLAKNTIRDFKRRRKEILHKNGASELRGFIKTRLNGNLQFDGVSEGFSGRIAHNVFPDLKVVSAFALLALLRSGANLQPVLDLSPKDWNQPNPFSPRYRTVVMTKRRSGKAKEPKLVKIPTLKRPQFYLYRALRYYQLLVAPLRNQIKNRGNKLGESVVLRERYAATLHDRFWLFLNASLELADLNENSVIRGINLLISDGCTQSPVRFACLLDASGEPIRFSSKAIRDSWFEFVLRNSRYNLMAGQIALSHSPDSPSIRHYIRHKWAKQFADREMRRFQTAAIAVLDDKKVRFSPTAIRVTLNGGEVLTLNPENRGRYGAYCRDPNNPPEHIYTPTDSEDVCPAASCDDCPYANYFSSSVPELIAEIGALERRADEMPLYVWEGSSDYQRLGRLKELLSRFPQEIIELAREKAASISVADIRFRTGLEK